MLKKDDPTEQLVYYQVTSVGLHVKSAVLTCFAQAGIGTYTTSVVKTPVLESVAMVRDSMFAPSLGDHVKGHSFLPRIPPSHHD
jgi:hypothetical protein